MKLYLNTTDWGKIDAAAQKATAKRTVRRILALLCTVFLVPALSESVFLPDADGENVKPDLIIDKDDRTVIEAPEFYPYSCVAFLDVICECGCGWECSGSVVGNGHTVLTAAHSVYCPQHSAPAESVIFYFGYHSYQKNLYRYDGAWSFDAGTSFDTHEYSFQNDWAIIHLEEDVGSITGILETVFEPDDRADSESVYQILGYSDGRLYMDYGPLEIIDETLFEYGMDQDFGASGGPILNGQNQVVGIIIGHREEEDGTKRNVGYRLTAELLEMIHEGDIP